MGSSGWIFAGLGGYGGSGRFWALSAVLGGSGRPWAALGGYGEFWTGLDGFWWLSALASCGQQFCIFSKKDEGPNVKIPTSCKCYIFNIL
jgi:hypothetical protein